MQNNNTKDQEWSEFQDKAMLIALFFGAFLTLTSQINYMVVASTALISGAVLWYAVEKSWKFISNFAGLAIAGSVVILLGSGLANVGQYLYAL